MRRVWRQGRNPRSTLLALSFWATALTPILVLTVTTTLADEDPDRVLAKNPNFVDPCVIDLERSPRSPHECECLGFLLDREQAKSVRSFLELRIAENPDDRWSAAALGAHLVDRPGDGALDPLQRSLSLFRESGEPTGEAYVQSLLLRFHQRRRNVEGRIEAEAQLARLLEAVDDPVVRARKALLDALGALNELRVDSGLLQLRRTISDPEFTTLPSSLQRGLLRAAANMSLVSTRYSEGLSLARRARQTCEENEFCWDNELFFRARTFRYMSAAWLIPKAEAADVTRKSYLRAEERGAKWASMLQLCELGHYTDSPESLDWFARCSEAARALHCEDISLVARMLHVAGTAKAEGANLPSSIVSLQDILQGLTRLGMEVESIAALGHLASLLRLDGRGAEAEAAMRQSIELAEKHQDRQLQAQGRADALALTAPQFYSLAGYLALDPLAGPPSVAEAFQVLERFRIRASYVERSRAEIDLLGEAVTGTMEARQALTGTRSKISGLQARLRNASIPDSDRDRLLEELTQLDLDEQDAVLTLAELDPESVRFERPHPASLNQLQQRLADDEILVAYQLAAVSEEAPWVLIVSADQVRAVSLPSDPMERTLGLYLGMLARRDGSEQVAAERLSSVLIQPVLTAVDEMAVVATRMIVIPDGRMFQLPLAALPQKPGGPELARRFELSYATSATGWIESQTAARSPLTGRALGVAGSPLRSFDGWMEPDVPSLRGVSGPDRPLALAPREVRDLVRRFGGAGRSLEAGAATEVAVKKALQESYGVVHIAAHAVSNHRRPSRSAVVLAGEGTADDGLLQPSEIAELDLRGTLVVLASCSSADGQRSRGGGPISLARAFTIAGAPAVIGTLWPVQDSDSVRFAAEFYRRWTEGMTASRALAETQRAMADAGLPVASWAAYVLIGSGDVRLESPIESAPGWSPVVLSVALSIVGLFVIGVAVWVRRRQRRRSTSTSVSEG